MTEMQSPNAQDIWRKYEIGLEYGRRTGRFNNAEKCWRFYEGDQWEGIKNTDGPLPIYNVIRSSVDYKIAKVAMNAKVIEFSAEKDRQLVLDGLNRKAKEAWEYGKMDDRCWEAAQSGFVEGNAFLYFPFTTFFDAKKTFNRCRDRSIFVQVIPGSAVILGDEEQQELQNQPYIILADRKLTESVKQVARENGVGEKEIDSIVSDERNEIKVTTGTKEEEKNTGGYTTVVTYFERSKSGIRFCRAVRDVIIQPFNDLKMDLYPIVHMPIKRQKGKARGVGEVISMIPNQIEINRTLLRRTVAVKMSAYPKPIYNSDYVDNPNDLDATGAKIEISGAQNLNNVLQAVGYLQPAAISADATILQNEMITTTKELVGAGDAALGNINPEQASGAAIVAVQDQADIPLNRELAAFAQMIEDIAILWFHMYQAANTSVLTYDGKHQDAGALAGLCPSIRVEIVSPDAAKAKANTLFMLVGQGHLAFDEFLELEDGASDIPVEKLKALRNKKKATENAVMEQQAAAVEREIEGAALNGMVEQQANQAFAGIMEE